MDPNSVPDSDPQHSRYLAPSLTLTTVTSLTFHVLKLRRFETIMFSDASLSDINVVLCYVLPQYRTIVYSGCRW
jgi:hypothetical protein